MRKTLFSVLFVLFPLILCVCSCAGSSKVIAPKIIAGEQPPEARIPEEFDWEELTVSGNNEFISAPVPPLSGPAGVGDLNGGDRDLGRALGDADRRALTFSYNEAYSDGLLRGIPLAGVLGGDLVHGWPPVTPVTWVQNWRDAMGKSNSWGIPALILAVRGLAHDRVFLVHGDILHVYGLGKGRNRANGAAGYGAPCGDEFLFQGRRAQRFDFGLLSFDERENPVFLPGAAPSLEHDTPPMVGQFQGEGGGPVITRAFQSAWKAGVDSGLSPVEPDTPVITIDFGDMPWILPAGPEDAAGDQDGFLTIQKIHYQGFSGGTVLFVLTEAALSSSGNSVNLPLYPRIVSDSFLAALLNPTRRLRGAQSRNPAGQPPELNRIAPGELDRALIDGIALYGIPLSAVLPYRVDTGLVEAQRFSRGWFVKRPELPPN